MKCVAGIVLAGGRSRRMGTPKAALAWHGSTLLRRTVGILARALGGPVVVVRAPGQELPELPDWVALVDDRREGRGPLEGIAAGLAAVAERADAAYVSATDMPALHPAFVCAVVEALVGEGVSARCPRAPARARSTARSSPLTGAGGPDRGTGIEPAVALPHVRGHRQPLAAAYRTSLAGLVEALVAEGKTGSASLFARVQVRELDAEALLGDRRLAAADPHLCSLVNVNEPEEYMSLHARPQPEVTIGSLRTLGGTAALAPGGVGSLSPSGLRVRAATLGGAVSAAGLELDQRLEVWLNGVRVHSDPQLPLVAGDVVSLAAPGS